MPSTSLNDRQILKGFTGSSPQLSATAGLEAFEAFETGDYGRSRTTLLFVPRRRIDRYCYIPVQAAHLALLGHKANSAPEWKRWRDALRLPPDVRRPCFRVSPVFIAHSPDFLLFRATLPTLIVSPRSCAQPDREQLRESSIFFSRNFESVHDIRVKLPRTLPAFPSPQYFHMPIRTCIIFLLLDSPCQGFSSLATTDENSLRTLAG